MRKIKLELERPIAFYAQLSRCLGGNDEAIYFQQLYYWSDKGARSDGFFYKSKDEIEEETCLSNYKQDKVRKKLAELGVLETKLLKANGAPTLHYRIIGETVQHLLDYQETKESILKKLDNPLTENTTETTITTTNVVGVPQDPTSLVNQPTDDDYDDHVVLNGELISPGDEIVVSPSAVVNPATESKQEYGNPDINNLVDTFQKTFDLKLKRVKQQRIAASNLIRSYGLTNTLGAIRAAGEVRDEQFAPQILSLEDLWSKWDKLVAYYRKKKSEQTTVTVIEED